MGRGFRKIAEPGRPAREAGTASGWPVERGTVEPAPGYVPLSRRNRRALEAVTAALAALGLALLSVVVLVAVPRPVAPTAAEELAPEAEALPELVAMDLSIVRRPRAVAPQPGPVTIRLSIPDVNYPQLSSFAVHCADGARWGPPVPQLADLPAGAKQIHLARVHPTGCRVQFRNGSTTIPVEAGHDLSCTWRSQLLCR